MAVDKSNMYDPQMVAMLLHSTSEHIAQSSIDFPVIIARVAAASASGVAWLL